MEKTYQVELTTTQPITAGEDFFMYRGYSSKEEALAVAKMLSSFFPYYKYATEVIVKEYDLIGSHCHNERIIQHYDLKDEEGLIVDGQVIEPELTTAPLRGA